MPFEIQQQLVQGVTQSGTPCTFTFSDTVTQAVVGIAYFHFEYSEDPHDHDIYEFTLAVTAGNQEGTSLPVTVAGTLKDDGGHSSDSDPNHQGNCAVVVAIAWTGSDDDSILLTNTNSFDSGQGSSVTVPSGDSYINQAVLSGFDLGYSNTDHWVAALNVSVSAQTPSQGSVTINGTSDMHDASGNDASTKTLSAGYIFAPKETGYGLAVKTVTTQTVGDGTLTVDFSDQLENGKYKLSSVYSILSGFTMSFPTGTDHQIWKLSAGVVGSWSTDGQSASTNRGAWAMMVDGDGNSEDDSASASNVTLLVLGLIEKNS